MPSISVVLFDLDGRLLAHRPAVRCGLRRPPDRLTGLEEALRLDTLAELPEVLLAH